jgi:hypothetical protein
MRNELHVYHSSDRVTSTPRFVSAPGTAKMVSSCFPEASRKSTIHTKITLHLLQIIQVGTIFETHPFTPDGHSLRGTSQKLFQLQLYVCFGAATPTLRLLWCRNSNFTIALVLQLQLHHAKTDMIANLWRSEAAGKLHFNESNR